MMTDIALRLNKEVIILDGAMGTMLQRDGFDTDGCNELLNVLDPESIIAIHNRYKLAGAQALTTNTFGGSRAKLSEYGLEDRVEELNRAAVRLAKSVKPEHVLADVGPCGLVLEPLGTATFDEVFTQYVEQINALAAEQPDALLIETMSDIADARCALLAAKSCCDLPVFVSCTFDASGYMELSGTDPATAAVILEACGADAIGMNCGLGPDQLLPLLKRMAAATSLPLIIKPNAGIPHLDDSGTTVFPGTADELARAAHEFWLLGAQFIGSCCGSTPVFTSALYGSLSGRDVIARPAPPSAAHIVLASPNHSVFLGADMPCAMIGERINPTGKPELAAELEAGKMSIVRRFCEMQENAGAGLIDVNVGAPMVDAKQALPQAALALRGFTSCPLVFDTTDPLALEAALRIYPGRALINSVNGDPESYEQVFPLARRYGAAVIGLALDEKGIPTTVEGRLEIVQTIRTAAHAHGLRDSDLLFDLLTMSAATDPNAPEVTARGVEHLTSLGLGSVLGVSNVSHGLPNRSQLNAAFVQVAIAAGLSAAIVNPNDEVMRGAIASSNAAGGKLGFDEALTRWRGAYEQALAYASGTLDTLGSASTSAATAQGQTADTAQAQGAVAKPEGDLTPEQRLRKAVLRGDKDATPDLIDEVVENGLAPDRIVDEVLAPTLHDLGEAFARGEAFLPQMMLAAGAMKVAVVRIREKLPPKDEKNSAGKVLFCTVKGDVHSIGKDICVALLESQDFTVFDLGVDVPTERILEVARAEDVNVICLSALMTTTLTHMKETVEAIYQKLPAFKGAGNKAVAVGGAVVTERWAESIGARYSPDAPTCVDLIRGICCR